MASPGTGSAGPTPGDPSRRPDPLAPLRPAPGPDGSAEHLSRFLARLTSATGALLIAVAGLTTALCLLLGILVVHLRDGVGSWIPLVIGSVAAVVVVALALDRRRLVRDLRSVRATHTITAPGGDVVLDGAPRGSADPDALRWNAATSEYRMRRDTPMPRIDAAQRAARTYLGGTVNSPWLERDARHTVALLLAAAAVVPVTATTAVVAAIVALTS